MTARIVVESYTSRSFLLFVHIKLFRELVVIILKYRPSFVV